MHLGRITAVSVQADMFWSASDDGNIMIWKAIVPTTPARASGSLRRLTSLALPETIMARRPRRANTLTELTSPRSTDASGGLR